MQTPSASTLTLLVLLPLLAWRAYARLRRMVGRQRLSRVRPWITLTLFPALVAVFGLAAMWWVGHDNTARSPRTAESASAVVSQAPEPVASPRDVVAEEQAPVARAANATPVVAAATPSAAPIPTAKAPAADAAVALAPTPVAPVANAPVSKLVLFVHQDSWADVRDAQQRRLLYETIPAGRVVSVDGVAPLSVFLGNVDGVTVEFNGKSYDVLRHKRGQVARFTLGLPPG